MKAPTTHGTTKRKKRLISGYLGGGSDGLGMPLTAQMMRAVPKKVMTVAMNPKPTMNAIL